MLPPKCPQECYMANDSVLPEMGHKMGQVINVWAKKKTVT
jgi:hypothetical protein